MLQRRIWFFIYFVLFAVFSVLPLGNAKAQPQLPQQSINSPSQLIDAVNNLRLSYGLQPLSVHPVLMQSSQSQADYMASTGQVTHSRPGGVNYTQQLLTLGFPLAGDLSLGGFRAENILSSGNPLVWNGVPSAWQDADHMNTMLSQNFTHIGAGISQSSGGYYYALDCAAATGSGQMQTDATVILTSVPASEGGNSSGISQFMVPVMISTARADGDVFHKVQYGQTLWSVAIEYGTTIKNIQALNNLGEDLVVYQGQELLVLKGATQSAPATSTLIPPSSPEFFVTSTPTALSVLSPTVQVASPAPTSLEEIIPASNSVSSSRLLIGVLIIAAFVGGGVAVWLIRDPN